MNYLKYNVSSNSLIKFKNLYFAWLLIFSLFYFSTLFPLFAYHNNEKIIVLNFVKESGSTANTAKELLKEDLLKTGHFAFSEDNYDNKIELVANGKFILLKVISPFGKNIFDIKSNSPSLQESIHATSDQLLYQLLRVRGLATSKILYTKRLRKSSKLGFFNFSEKKKYLITKTDFPISSPSISKSSKGIFFCFSGYIINFKAIFLTHFKTGGTILIDDPNNRNSGPFMSRDGKKIVFSSSKSGAIDLYIHDLGSLRTKRLTYNDKIEFSPTFSPNNKKVYFSQLTEHGAKIFWLSTNFRIPHIIKTTYNYCLDPTISPDNKLLAFVAYFKENQKSSLILYSIKEKKTISAISKGFISKPTWGPDSNNLLFLKNGKIVSYNLITGEEQPINSSIKNVSEINWSS